MTPRPGAPERVRRASVIGLERSVPAADAELVFAVCATDTLGEVTLLAVNHLAPHHQECAGQGQHWPPAADEQVAAEVGDRVGEPRSRRLAEPAGPQRRWVMAASTAPVIDDGLTRLSG